MFFRIFLFLLVLIFPALSFAAGMTKQEACMYEDGIYREEVYVLWPDKLPQIDGFLKKNGFLYYFIHTFPDTESLAAYRDAGNRDLGYIKNTGSYFVSFDCARSKVKFYPSIRSIEWTTYGKLNWINGDYLDYSLVSRYHDPCITSPDALISVSNIKKLNPDKTRWLAHSNTLTCVARSPYKLISDGLIEWETEQQKRSTEESFYSKYQYTFLTNKLKKISTTEMESAPDSSETSTEDIDYRIYKKPILADIRIEQTDIHTHILYKWKVIKEYVNSEFATELLPHGPNEEPDCYNSLQRQIPSSRAKDIIGKDYLRSCLVLQTKKIGARYIVFYGPWISGNRLSLYDIQSKKFYHNLVNNILDAQVVLDGGLVFLSKDAGSLCRKKVSIYIDGSTRVLFDECSLANTGIPYISIDRITTEAKALSIYYTPYVTLPSGDMILDRTKKSKKIINF